MAYDYKKEMIEDIIYFLTHNKEYAKEAFEREEQYYDDIEDFLHDFLWDEDEVTGNGSDGYFASLEDAKESVLDNMTLYVEAEKEFGGHFDYLENLDWKAMDATIRCYLLANVLYDHRSEIEQILQ